RYADGAGTCVEALEAAGGAVQSVTKLAPSFSFRIETSADSVVSDLRRRRPGISEGREGVVKVLAAVIARGGSASDLRALTGARLIEPQGDYDRPVNAVVLIGGGRDETDRRWEAVDQPIIDELAEFGIVVVGVEPSDSVQSYIPAYQAKSISTVDNVDTPIGRAAMVLLVSGERGSYGTRATARDGVVPPGASEQ
ncbi:MAG: hypothetical protein FJX72_18475, partial [Armatimonadetes bacterium]|nr:hypothetical protein [Armatimonadota bacterium]